MFKQLYQPGSLPNLPDGYAAWNRSDPLMPGTTDWVVKVAMNVTEVIG